MKSEHDNWKLIEKIYEHALTLRQKERSAYVKKESNQNDDIYTQVINMLQVSDDDDFMLQIPNKITSQALKSQFDRSRIGHFEIIKKIASGGMGVVYKARSKLSDVDITVALKTIRTELKNAEMESRFFNEKTIHAKLKHKNIATLIEAGVDENSVPYIATEWIDGENIIRYCENNKLGLKSRLHLFNQLCGAVSHAHNQFVIHRDLKPANILIDKNQQVKLLDFGIAKLTEDNKGNATKTQIFTPDYAAPEQINGMNSSVVTDVYSLGVLLFELLTAKKRFNLEGLSISERINLICDPSHINASDLVLDKNHPVKSHNLKGALNTIINKAMHVDKSRRYQSVALLMDDLNRFLTNRPITAIKDSWYYRFSMFVTRNLWSSVLALLVFVSLVTGIFVSMQQANIAQKEANKSRQLQEFYKKSLHSASPVNGGSTTITVREMFVNGARTFDLDSIDDPLTRAETAAEIGLVFAELEEYELSKKYTQFAIDYYAKNLKNHASQYLKNSNELARYHGLQHNYSEALRYIDRAYEISKVWTIDPEIKAETYINMGAFYDDLNEKKQALKFYNKAEIIAEKDNDQDSLGKINYYKYILLREQENNQYLNGLLFKAQNYFEQAHGNNHHPDLIALRNSLAIRLTAQGDYLKADEIFEKLSQQVSLNTEKINYENYINRANVKYYLGDFQQAIDLTSRALDRMKQLSLKPSFTEMAAKIIQARALTELSQFKQSNQLYSESYAFFSLTFDDSHKVIQTLKAYRMDHYIKSGDLLNAQTLSYGMDTYAQDQLTEAHSNQNRYVNIMMVLACLASQNHNHELALKYYTDANKVLQSNTKQQGWIYWVIQAGIEKSQLKLNNTESIEEYNAAKQQLFAILNNHHWYAQFFNINHDK
ncbi:MAG: protein kinase [Marinicellaceae bacterium]